MVLLSVSPCFQHRSARDLLAGGGRCPSLLPPFERNEHLPKLQKCSHGSPDCLRLTDAVSLLQGLQAIAEIIIQVDGGWRAFERFRRHQ